MTLWLEGTVHTSEEPAYCLAYLADFANLASWDPGIAESRQLSQGSPLEPGARFEVFAKVGMTRSRMIYELVEFVPNQMAVQRGEGLGIVATDTIHVARESGRTIITWRAAFVLARPRRITEPALRPFLPGLGERAMKGLARKLDGTAGLVTLSGEEPRPLVPQSAIA